MDAFRKRDFILKAFYPKGGEVADEIGMFPVSPEVGDYEGQMTAEAVTSTQELLDFDAIFEMAGWFNDAIATRVDSENHDREPVEDLVSFYVAVHHVLNFTKAPVLEGSDCE